MSRTAFRILLGFFLITASVGHPANGHHCTWPWVPHSGSCYLYHGEHVNQRGAMTVCRAQGGYLVEIDSPAENDFVVRMSQIGRGGPLTWIGLSDSKQEGRFVLTTSHREPTYINWHRGEPNNYFGQEDCAVVNVDNGKWDDVSCMSGFPFICEQGSPSPPTQPPPPPTTTTTTTTMSTTTACQSTWCAIDKAQWQNNLVG